MYKLFPASFILFGSFMFYWNGRPLWGTLALIVGAALVASAFHDND